jgi:hypothetical protein
MKLDQESIQSACAHTRIGEMGEYAFETNLEVFSPLQFGENCNVGEGEIQTRGFSWIRQDHNIWLKCKLGQNYKISVPAWVSARSELTLACWHPYL